MIRTSFFAAAALVTAVCPSAHAAPPASLDTAVREAMDTHAIPALGAAYVEDGQVVWSAVWGAPEDTLFNVASMAKPVAAETILRLASRGALDLDAPMSAHYVDPDIAADPRAEQLTLRLALSHRTGFPNWRYQTDGVLQFTADPGTRPGYSGEGYEYAGAYAQAALDTQFDVLMAQEVLNPAGAMDAVVFGPNPGADPRRATPHNAAGEPLAPSIADPWSAADDLWTTADGYGLILASVMRGDGLTEAIAAERHAITFDQAPFACAEPPFSEFCPEALGFALGYAVFEYANDTIVMQGGGDEGESALSFFSPQTGRGLVIMSNSVNGRKLFPLIAETATDTEEFIAFLQMQAGG